LYLVSQSRSGGAGAEGPKSINHRHLRTEVSSIILKIHAHMGR
jgi:hypothetical protein